MKKNPLVLGLVLISLGFSYGSIQERNSPVTDGPAASFNGVKKARASTENLVYTYDFEKKKETQYSDNEIHYAQNIEQEPYDPSEGPITTRGIYGSPEAYHKMPFSAICGMFVTYDTNKDGIGDKTFTRTATIVGRNIALTACEATIHPTMGYPTSITLSPGLYTNSGAGGQIVRPFGEIRPTSLARGNYLNTKHANDNWALLYLPTNIGEKTGWFGVSDTGISSGNQTITTGQANASDYTTMNMYGTVSSVSTYSFTYQSREKQRESLIGAPVQIPGKRLNVLHGIHTSQVSYSGGNYHYSACKISHYIENWLQDSGGLIRVTIFSRFGGSSSSSSSSGSSSSSSSFGDLGHAWITVENLSSEIIHAGKMEIAPNVGASLGTWPITGRWGLWYNLEYRGSQYDPNGYLSRVSISKFCFLSQWDDANQLIVGSDWWMPIDNCTKFAIEAWNAAFPLDTFEKGTIPKPENLFNDIKSRPGYKMNAYIPGTFRTGYYDNDIFHPSTGEKGKESL